MNLQDRLANIDWQTATAQLDSKGYTVVPALLPSDQCDELVANYGTDKLYRKTVVMERHGYGKGAYRYFTYPLPTTIQQVREYVYPRLAPVANGWMQQLKIATEFPATFAELQQQCHTNNQTKATALILKYGHGGYNAMHQDLYGDIYFPMQMVVFLDQVGVDYTGGEFVLLQQNPRAQSKAVVLSPGKGDALIFTTNFRPIPSVRGYTRATMRHGVSEVHTGERNTLGIIFHDALS